MGDGGTINICIPANLKADLFVAVRARAKKASKDLNAAKKKQKLEIYPNLKKRERDAKRLFRHIDRQIGAESRETLGEHAVTDIGAPD
jgi:muconolactone delta-isomerase